VCNLKQGRVARPRTNNKANGKKVERIQENSMKQDANKNIEVSKKKKDRQIMCLPLQKISLEFPEMPPLFPGPETPMIDDDVDDTAGWSYLSLTTCLRDGI
jgi:hypothetical protein